MSNQSGDFSSPKPNDQLVPSPPKVTERLVLSSSKESSFTLIELLIVVGLIALLAGAVILVLNPAQLLDQSRDGTRVQDLENLQTGLALYVSEGNSALGSPNLVYVSIPDTSATCGNLGLPTLPAGQSYHCATSANLEKTDGSGWLPVDFNLISAGAPFASLPIDPVNTTSSQEFFTYAEGTSTYELTSYFESNKYASVSANDGGADPSTYELGSNLSLTPFIHGLVGYWPLNDGSGPTAKDLSGWGNNGSLQGATDLPTWTTTNCLTASPCLSFDGGDDLVDVPYTSSLNGNTQVTVVAWVNPANFTNAYQGIVGRNNNGAYNLMFNGNTGNLRIELSGTSYTDSVTPLVANNWTLAAVVVNETNSTIGFYVNGTLDGTVNIAGYPSLSGTTDLYFGWEGLSGRYLNGKLGGIHVYKQALTAAQIQAIYNAKQ